MTARISSRKGGEITIEIKVRLSGSILEREEQVLEGLNEGGNIAAQEMLKDFDADGGGLTAGGIKRHSKGRLPKTYNTPCGTATVERHVYQSSQGGTTLTSLRGQCKDHPQQHAAFCQNDNAQISS